MFKDFFNSDWRPRALNLCAGSSLASVVPHLLLFSHYMSHNTKKQSDFFAGVKISILLSQNLYFIVWAIFSSLTSPIRVLHKDMCFFSERYWAHSDVIF